MEPKSYIVMALVAVAWFVIGNILMATLGVKMAPHGGMDSVGEAILYVVIWRMAVMIPPILILIVDVCLWLRKYHGRGFYVVSILVVLIVVAVILNHTLIRRIRYTPEYMANKTLTYAEYREGNLNAWEKERYSELEKEERYVYWQMKHTFEAVKWAKTGNQKEAYVKSFMEKRLPELQNVKEYQYISDHKPPQIILTFQDGTTATVDLDEE